MSNIHSLNTDELITDDGAKYNLKNPLLQPGPGQLRVNFGTPSARQFPDSFPTTNHSHAAAIAIITTTVVLNLT
jgi:hypothetical protein